jgi:uncharacterized delta-60 repeat protein
MKTLITCCILVGMLTANLLVQRTSSGQRANGLPAIPDDVKEQWVRHYESRLIPNVSAATSIATDSAGNIYVGGNSRTSFQGDNANIIKYNSTGLEQWRVYYPGNVVALTVDKSGNVYVTGSTEVDAGGDQAFLTAQYDASGAQLWLVRYETSAQGSSGARAVAVDAAGNVYVAGEGPNERGNRDYITIKYEASGVAQWVARYNGPADRFEEAAALTVDAAGNVYVTGASQVENGLYYEYATVKYDAAGIEQWAARANEGRPVAMAVDAAGHVYVTGSNFATIKYDAAGIQQWVAHTAGSAAALVIDNLGNVYVAGAGAVTGLDLEYKTIKYNSSGMVEWAQTYGNSGFVIGPYRPPFNDAATDLAVDRAGNVYVTGMSFSTYYDLTTTVEDYATIKYNSAGERQWVARYNGPAGDDDEASALALDDSGNVYVTGRSVGTGTSRTLYVDYDYATIKYNANGSMQWLARFQGENYSDDRAAAFAVDDSGNAYITGTSVVSVNPFFREYSTVKFSSAGDLQWAVRYDGHPGYPDDASGLALDPFNNIYVTGRSITPAINFATVQYNSSGMQQWRREFPITNGFATDVALDDLGNVYVTGESMGEGTKYDFVTVKYNPAGVEQWARRYNGPANLDDVPHAIVVKGSGDIYVTGESMEANQFTRSYTTIKYDASGIEQWVARYRYSADSYNVASAIAVDHADQVYVTGTSAGAYATIKYDSTGAQQWLVRYQGQGNPENFTTAIGLDGSGNIYVTGRSGDYNAHDYATVKYDGTGAEQWVARYDGPARGDDYATAMVVDETGNAYVTGGSVGLNTQSDIATVKYSAAGYEQWVVRYGNPENVEDIAVDMAVDRGGNVYVAGSSYKYLGWSVYTIVKYAQTPTAVKERETAMPAEYQLAQNYPNPFNPSTKIRYVIAKPGRVILKVFNLRGQVVATLVNENKATGEYEIQWNPAGMPSGVYVYRLQVEGPSGTREFVEAKKLILLR